MSTPTASDLPPATRPGANAWAQMILAEMRMVIRDTAGLILPIGMPSLLMIMMGQGSANEPVDDLGGMTVLEWYLVPTTLVMVMTLVGVVNMPSFLAAYRKYGVLRRLGVTPAHPLMILVAQVITSVIQTAIGIGLALVLADVVFGLQGPRELVMTIAMVVLVAAAMYAVGMFIAAVSPTANAAIAFGLVGFFAFGATGGMFGPTENLPTSVQQIGELLPYGAGMQAIQDAWTGMGVEGTHLLALGVAIVVSVAGSAIWFRWD